MSKTERALRKAEEERREQAFLPAAKKGSPKENSSEPELRQAVETVKPETGSRLKRFIGGLFGSRKKTEDSSRVALPPLPERRQAEPVRVMPRVCTPQLVEPVKENPPKQPEQQTVAVSRDRIADARIRKASEEMFDGAETVSAGDLEIEEIEHLIFIGREKEKPSPH